jgi:hypothetical protein
MKVALSSNPFGPTGSILISVADSAVTRTFPSRSVTDDDASTTEVDEAAAAATSHQMLFIARHAQFV